MKTSIHLSLYAAVLGFLVLSFSAIAAPQILSVTSNGNVVPKYSMLELIPEITASYVNPYDYGDIGVGGTFTSPSGMIVNIDGFYMQGCATNSAGYVYDQGSGSFRLRFTPDEVGVWHYQLRCETINGTAQTGVLSFECTASENKGFVRLQPGARYLQWDDGAQYIPIGMNLCWGGSGESLIAYYSRFLENLSANNANYIRVWMAAWSFGLEWSPSSLSWFEGLMVYDQHSAYKLDWLLEEAQRKQIAVMICDNHHDQFMTTKVWYGNAYNTVNGGMCDTPDEFFTDPVAIAAYQNRLRYMVARYGYSTQISSWELFNEVDQLWLSSSEISANGYDPDQVRQDITDWHETMSTYLKTIDPNGHLITTSTGRPATNLDLFALSDIDTVQFHSYILDANPEKKIVTLIDEYTANYDKPIFVSEYGLSLYEQEALLDAGGIHFHNGMWASLFSGAAGPVQEWNWNYIYDENLFSDFSAIALVADDIDFVADGYFPTAATTTFDSISASGVGDITIVPEYGSWGAAPTYVFDFDESGEMNPGVEDMSRFLYGRAQYQASFVFTVHYPEDGGTFTVNTSDIVNSNSGEVEIRVDGVVRGGSYGANANEQGGQTYTVTDISKNADGEKHTIEVLNDGSDWVLLDSFEFGGVSVASAVTAASMDVSFEPMYGGWGFAPANTFNIDLNGTIQPGVEDMGRFLYGVAQYQDPFIFTVHYADDDGTFAVRTSETPNVNEGQVEIRVDGVVRGGSYGANANAQGGQTYTVTGISKNADGEQHTIEVINEGSDWVYLAGFDFGGIGGGTQTATSSDVLLTPAYTSWGAAPTHTFDMDLTGAINPGVEDMSRFLYGRAQYQESFVFTVHYPEDGGTFTVNTSETPNSNEGQVEIRIDGVVRGGSYGANANAQGGQTYTVTDISKNADGEKHTIEVLNDGSDWVLLDSFEFGGVVSTSVTSASVDVPYCDISIIPACSTWGNAPTNTFEVTEQGDAIPGEENLSKFLFGRAQFQEPVIFKAHYPEEGGTFIVNTGDMISSGGAELEIRVNGVVMGGSYGAAAEINHSYVVADIPANLPGEVNTIEVTNSGADWILISEYLFEGIGNPLTAYVMTSADANKAVGWLHNRPADWLAAESPEPIQHGIVYVEGMNNGSYDVTYYDCLTAEETTASATAENGMLTLRPLEIEWDCAFKAVNVNAEEN